MSPTSTTTGRVLIVEEDGALGALYADVISTHCPGVRVDVCRPSDRTLIDDNAGGADVAICACGSTGATRFETLRILTMARACLRVVLLAPAHMPGLVEEGLAAGASDALLRAPGYLDQLPTIVRRGIREARAMLVHTQRVADLTRLLSERTAEVHSLRARLSVVERPPQPLPEIYIRRRAGRTVLRLVHDEPLLQKAA